MKILVLRILLTAIALAGWPASALAVPVLWTLNGVTFSDGATASGSFVYDADTNTYSAANITTTAGSTMSAATYRFVCAPPCAPVSTSTLLYLLTVPSSNNLSGLQNLDLFVNTALTDSGGTVTVRPDSGEDTCGDAICNLLGPPFNTTTAGTVVGTQLSAIQLPALSTWALVVLALLLAGAVASGRWRQKRSVNGR